MIRKTLIIVAAADQAGANADAASLPDGNPADRLTFTAPLSPSGAAPATHYIAAPQLSDGDRAIVEQLRAKYPAATVVDYDLAADPTSEPNAPPQVLARLGLKPVAGAAA